METALLLSQLVLIIVLLALVVRTIAVDRQYEKQQKETKTTRSKATPN